MKNLVQALEKAGFKPDITRITNIKDSMHHKDVINFLKRKRHAEKQSKKIHLEFKGYKLLELKHANYNPNEIIEVNYPWREVRGLPPLRMTRREYDKRIEKEDRAYHNWLVKFLKEKERLDKLPVPNIRFGCQNSLAYAY